MKWPKKVNHRNKLLAKIYQPCEGWVSYRVAWTAAGERQMKSFYFLRWQGQSQGICRRAGGGNWPNALKLPC